MIQLQRAPGESVERFLRRFRQKLRQTRQLNLIKAKNYHSSKPTRRQVKKSALHRQKMKKRVDYLKKVGKIADDNQNEYYRKR